MRDWPKRIRNKMVQRVRSVARRIIRPIILAEPNLPARYRAYQEEQADFLIEPAVKRDPSPAASLPVPPRNLWMATGPGGYGDTDQEFLEMGRKHAASSLAMLAEAGGKLGPGSRILDFGCATGRLTRWFADPEGSREVWGVDINAEAIVWCQRHLSPPLHFCTITTIPHLPFEDGYFDFSLAGSVFTHIDELADAWLLELRRVLRTGGHLYLTVIDKHSLEIVGRNPALNLARQVADAQERGIPLRTADFAVASIQRSYTVYDIGHLKRKLGSIYEILGVKEESYGFQTAILVRKRGS